tara:strand:+ start:5200 stop:5343 length:144 start_codon:yes stop_codon:yes gene_type:complete
MVLENLLQMDRLLKYFNDNPDFRKEFDSWTYDMQKTSVKILIALKKI